VSPLRSWQRFHTHTHRFALGCTMYRRSAAGKVRLTLAPRVFLYQRRIFLPEFPFFLPILGMLSNEKVNQFFRYINLIKQMTNRRKRIARARRRELTRLPNLSAKTKFVSC
jgi:hypothetical protein